jgi:hypothetical protein
VVYLNLSMFLLCALMAINFPLTTAVAVFPKF